MSNCDQGSLEILIMHWQPLWFSPDQPPAGMKRILLHHRQAFLANLEGLMLWSETDPFLKGITPISQQGLGVLNGNSIILYELDHRVELPETQWVGLRQSMSQLPGSTWVQMLCFASQIGTWAVQHRFCGFCGTSMQPLTGERAMGCPACGLHHYPRIAPCMIALVTRGDEVLLARSPRHAPGVFSTLAGFVEAGENIEQCVAREVLEEVGVQVQNPRYIASQSWPFPHSLMLGFHVDYVDGEIVPQPEEIEAASWFSIHALPKLPADHTIARHLIEHYIANRLGNPLPVWGQ